MDLLSLELLKPAAGYCVLDYYIDCVLFCLIIIIIKSKCSNLKLTFIAFNENAVGKISQERKSPLNFISIILICT